MLIILILSIIPSIIIIMMMILLNLISMKKKFNQNKSSPFECGFDPKSSARLPFSLQFFLIAVIFLIFDVELTLLLPFILMLKTSNLLNISLIFSIFILILIMSVLHEWNQGALNWKI